MLSDLRVGHAALFCSFDVFLISVDLVVIIFHNLN